MDGVKKRDNGIEITGNYPDSPWIFKTVDCRTCNTQPKHYLKDAGRGENVILCLGCGSVTREIGGRSVINEAVRSWNNRNQPDRESRCGNCLNWGSAYPKKFGRERICSWCSAATEGGDGYGCRGFSPKIKQL